MIPQNHEGTRLLLATELLTLARYTLLGYMDAAGHQYDAFAEGCRAFDSLLPGFGSAVLIVSPGCEMPRDEDITALCDSANEFASTFQACGGTVWIVRPDGHMGGAAVNARPLR